MRQSLFKRVIHSITQRIESGNKWLARKRLELELIRLAAIERSLTQQIASDAEALAYSQIQQVITTVRLKRLIR